MQPARRYVIKPPRVFELYVRTTGMLEGEFRDWPANIQDGVYKALADKQREVGLPLMMVASKVDLDFDGKPAVHVVAMEMIIDETKGKWSQ